jgi:hypothetical protein
MPFPPGGGEEADGDGLGAGEADGAGEDGPGAGEADGAGSGDRRPGRGDPARCVRPVPGELPAAVTG